MKIIAGELKGKILTYPKDRLRPTTDKIRGAVFNMIEANFPTLLNNAIVCDIFSGAGAVGIEALSRGAINVTCIENDKVTLKYLKENLHGLENRSIIIPIDAIKTIDKIRDKKFDLIFLDPPYNMGLVELTVKKVARYNMLKEEGIMVIEHHKKEIFSTPLNMSLFKIKDYSDTLITILVHKEEK
jgi:16S rRNA (guanine966-N2)-methyltransferase